MSLLHLISGDMEFEIGRCTRNVPPNYTQEADKRVISINGSDCIAYYNGIANPYAEFFCYKDDWMYTQDRQFWTQTEFHWIDYKVRQKRHNRFRGTSEPVKRIPKNEYFVRSEIKQDTQKGLGDFNDCTVRALAHIFDITYDESHDIMEELGRKQKKGFRLKPYMMGLKLAGHKFKSVPFRPMGRNMNLKAFADMNKEGSFLVFTRGHVQTLVQGKYHDHSFKPKDEILGAYELIGKIDAI